MGATLEILFYVSGHGLGHATRQVALLQAVRERLPEAVLHLRTMVPEGVFREVAGPVVHTAARIDTGVVERDLFHQDPRATLAAYAELHGQRERLLEAETAYVRSHGIRLIACDIPALAAEVGQRCGVPVLAVSNFGWDGIYTPYVEEHPAYRWVLDAIREDYQHTTLLLRLPFCVEMDAFPHRRDVPLLVRKPPARAEQTLRELELPAEREQPLVLVGGRMFPYEALRASDLIAAGDCIVLVLGGSVGDLGPHVRQLGPEWTSRFLDLLEVSHVLISKIGYGTVADCIACRTALVYPPRYGFVEVPLLEAGTPGVLPMERVPHDDFLAGRWKANVDRALARSGEFGPCTLDGAGEGAAVIAGYAL